MEILHLTSHSVMSGIFILSCLHSDKALNNRAASYLPIRTGLFTLLTGGEKAKSYSSQTRRPSPRKNSTRLDGSIAGVLFNKSELPKQPPARSACRRPTVSHQQWKMQNMEINRCGSFLRKQPTRILVRNPNRFKI